MVAGTNTTVLITGETGTGKELVARAIHEPARAASACWSRSTARPSPPGLVESELFGHEKGAFTGARRSAQGTLRAGARRNAVPRRGRRAAAGDAGQAAARAAGARVRARRRQRDRSASTCGVIAATNRNLREMVARAAASARTSTTGSTSSRWRCRRCASAPTTSRCWCTRSCGASPARPASRIDDVSPEAMAPARALQLARQRPRAAERDRARGDPVARSACVDMDALPDLSAAAPSPRRDQPAPPPATPCARRPDHRRGWNAATSQQVLTETRWVIEGERGAARRLGLHPNTLRSRLKRWG